MSLRDVKKNQERENARLAWSFVDIEQDERVLEFLNFQESVDKAFECAIIHQNVKLAQSLIYNHSIRPCQEVIDTQFRKVAREGSDPVLVNFLQSIASQNELCSEERAIKKNRQETPPELFCHYMVGFLEYEKLAEISQRNNQSISKTKKTVLQGPQRLQSMFRDQLWMNGIFFDCVHSQNKYTVLKLLHVKSDGESAFNLKPNQMTINNAFVHCIHKGYLSMAGLLTGHTNHYDGGYFLGVDQAGFDEGFRAAVESEVLESVQWMLSGRHGMVPSQGVIDEVYRQHRAMPPYMQARTRGTLAYRKEAERVRALNHHRAVVLKSFKHRITATARKNYQMALGPDAVMPDGLYPPVADGGDDDDENGDDGRPPRGLDGLQMANLRGMHRGLGANNSIYSYYAAQVNPAVAAAGDRREEGDENAAAVAQGNEAVQMPAAAPFPVLRNSNATPANTLDQAVLRCMERRNGGITLNKNQIIARMSDLIFQTFPNEREQRRAVDIVTVGMNDANIHLLGTTLYFLQSFPPRDVEIWIQGFLVESIVVNSCNPGAMKRIVTGLRGVEDPELNELFRQAEGPNLARIFLTNTFNIYHPNPRVSVRAWVDAQNANPTAVDDGVTNNETEVEMLAIEPPPNADAEEEDDAGEQDLPDFDEPARQRTTRGPVDRAVRLATLLVDQGITTTSSLEAVSDVLTEIARSTVAGYGVDVEAFNQEIAMSVESVMDCYDDILMLYVTAVLNIRGGLSF